MLVLFRILTIFRAKSNLSFFARWDCFLLILNFLFRGVVENTFFSVNELDYIFINLRMNGITFNDIEFSVSGSV